MLQPVISSGGLRQNSSSRPSWTTENKTPPTSQKEVRETTLFMQKLKNKVTHPLHHSPVKHSFQLITTLAFDSFLKPTTGLTLLNPICCI